jgi:hypothetical protein
MVKPHSPIMECKQSAKSSWDGEGFRGPAQAVENSSEAKNIPTALPRSVTFQDQSIRRVTFSKKVSVKEITHRNNMSERICEEYWMSQEDFQTIKAHLKVTIKMMMTNREIDEEDEDYCTRGLEFRTREGRRQRNKNKVAARRVVLLQQKVQLEEGVYDPEFIALVSAAKTAQSPQVAHQMALRDAEEARGYF